MTIENIKVDKFTEEKVDSNNTVSDSGTLKKKDGNEINDYDVMKIIGIPICPNDAVDKIKKISKKILSTKGGHGISRELYALIEDNTFE